MRIGCSQCRAQYELPSGRLNGGAVRVRCSRCGGLFVVRRRLPEALGPPPLGRPFLVRGDYAPEPPPLLELGFGLAEDDLDLFPPGAPFTDLDLPTRFPRPRPSDGGGRSSSQPQSAPPHAIAPSHLSRAGELAGPPADDGRAGDPLPPVGRGSGASRRTQIVSEPVRSGQRVCAGAADLVVLGGVSSGAEVVADGNIHVYGVLRGKAVAGASGDAEARIFCLGLDAELVSVGGTTRMLEQVSDELRGKPAQVYLCKEALLIEPIGPAHFLSSRASGPAFEAGRSRPAPSGSAAERNVGARAPSGLRVAVAVR